MGDLPTVEFASPPALAPRARVHASHALSVAAALAGALYLGWRLLFTLDTGFAPLGVLLLAAETYIYTTMLAFLYVVWETDETAPFDLPDGLSVDIFITTYNEPEPIVRATVLGALAMDYPHRTVILDDGRRDSIRRIAAELGCDYVTRPDNVGHKAGNINNALTRSTAEFIVVFDADHVPQRTFLTRTLGYFVDPRLAVVQTPQDFYNLSSRQHTDSRARWHEQTLFYHVIQPGKNRANSAFWCGSCATIRRAALDDIGGVATASVTEDLLTTIRLQRAGWKTFFHRETLAYGIAPDDFEAFETQRLRWAQGTMQILRSRENPTIAGGLTLAQRVSYLSSMLTYFDAYIRLALLLLPVAVLGFGLPPFQVSGWTFALHFAPYLALSILATTAAQRGMNILIWSERFALAKMFIFIRASAMLITGGRTLKFKVTPKRVTRSSKHGGRGVRALIVVSVTAAIAGLAAVAGLGPAGELDRWLILVNVAWALGGSALLWAVTPLFRQQYWQRNAYRFPWPVPFGYELTRTGALHSSVTHDISWGGLSFIGPDDLRLDDELDLVIVSPGEAPIRLYGRVRFLLGPGKPAGIEFVDCDQDSLDRLVLFLVTRGAAEQDHAEAERWDALQQSLSA